MSSIMGLHHITALSADPQANIYFYTKVLGLRLVKVSVNQDEPNVYHFFYADYEGNPGSDLTFFPYPRLPRGVPGYGQAVRIIYTIHPDSVKYWIDRFKRFNVTLLGLEENSEGVRINFVDWDGLGLSLQASDRPSYVDVKPWSGGGVPKEHFPRGFYSVVIMVRDCHTSGYFLEDILGFEKADEGEEYAVYTIGGGGPGRVVELLCPREAAPGRLGAGTVHHVAFAVKDLRELAVHREKLVKRGYNVTPVIDRKWFTSIYFREPGGVLYEIATIGPGFTVDEPVERLGSRLVLPEWLEPYRGEIEASLPKVRLPSGSIVGGAEA
ncbi:hypothetical protein APE_0688 [Aeropyrum pernix K1]|uniref:VOC domain-containing protein n=1 Tax=Aeropyrum pernix (strain ATCC 700893 / DSM 11879 / JCM 9820 / NBRC 100138 / K1) TaxID=272557 RepID=Q9YE82_AERPE|nr:ring-cleaving dioxygenase [Aeropyrum pernix]BAA79664.1 hypothetical protein APE_0688 [Aeropyrum pernix K1]